MARRHKRSKAWGRENENSAVSKLRRIFPNLRRVGSVGHTRSHPDLVQDGMTRPLRLIVTRDKRQPQLVSMTIDDLEWLLTLGSENWPKVQVYVQVKARARTWLGTLYKELREATK